jgi:hypothetical protein
MTAEQIAAIIWQEHSRWNGVPASSSRDTWGYKAAERIALEFDRLSVPQVREAADEIEWLQAEIKRWEDTDRELNRVSAEWAKARAEIERLRAVVVKTEADCKAVCDSYANENQQFHDEIERLTEVLQDCQSRAFQQRHELNAEIEHLRAALMPFAKNANAVSLSDALGHISREDLERAKEALR